eukprot:12928484-Prorocentrum_lima.AAC.1
MIPSLFRLFLFHFLFLGYIVEDGIRNRKWNTSLDVHRIQWDLGVVGAVRTDPCLFLLRTQRQ